MGCHYSCGTGGPEEGAVPLPLSQRACFREGWWDMASSSEDTACSRNNLQRTRNGRIRYRRVVYGHLPGQMKKWSRFCQLFPPAPVFYPLIHPQSKAKHLQQLRGCLVFKASTEQPRAAGHTLLLALLRKGSCNTKEAQAEQEPQGEK